jgi:hypothetical protein
MSAMAEAAAERYELKYSVGPDELRMARAMIAPFMRPDDHALEQQDIQYTVRTVYFDTPSLQFYYEKEAGKKIRKKLRLRTYNDYSSESVGFAEIKRKHGHTILKERAPLPFDQIATVVFDSWNGRVALADLTGLDLSAASRASLERFLYFRTCLSLRPAVLVVYEREPFVARDNERIRVTFDRDVRSRIRPTVDEIFEDDGLRFLTDRRRILEIKFDGAMPPWLSLLTRRLNRSHEPISKYCRCLESWATPS